MQDYVIVIIATLAGVIAISLFFFLCYCLLRNYKYNKTKKPERATSRIYPRISSPIYAISNNSIDKKPNTTAGDTIRKCRRVFASTENLPSAVLSVFDRKRPSAFSTNSLYYGDSSPRVAHKEYLDFNAIESILPSSAKNDQTRPQTSTGIHGGLNRRMENNRRPSSRSSSQDGSLETDDTRVSDESLNNRDLSPPAPRGRISIIEERPFGGTSSMQSYNPVREIYRENNVYYQRDEL